MSTRTRRSRQSVLDTSPSRTRKGVSPSLSPARTQKNSSAARSPSRRSPARRSPSRKTSSNYPARKSPSRAVKENKVEKESDDVLPKSPVKRPTIKKEAEIRLYDLSVKQETYRTTRSRRLEYSVKDIPDSVTEIISPVDEKLNGFEARETIPELYNLRNRKTVDESGLRRSKLRDYTDSSDTRRSFTKSLSKSISKSISTAATYSDEENYEELLDKKSVNRKLSTPLPSIGLSQFNNKLEFGGRIGSALLIFLIPLMVFTILLSCKNTCSYEILKTTSSFTNLSVWIDSKCMILVAGQYILQALLVLIPVFGAKEVDKQGQRNCFNGFFSSFITLSIVGFLDYYKIINSDLLLNKTLQMAVVSYLIAMIVSVILYTKRIKSEESINPYGHPQYALYNFFMGREIQPTIVNLNVKLWLSRVTNITALILSIIVLKRGIHFKENIEKLTLEELSELSNRVVLKPTVLIFSMMQIIYSLNFLMKERKITSTFYWQSEGMGYLQTVSSALYPYYFITMSKYVANTEISLPVNLLIAASTLFVLGFLIMLISNNIKYEFRKNPLHPSLTYLDSMPTFHGKKLLVSNLWGVLRHPNYAGDIMIHLSLALPGLYKQQFIAAAPALLTIIVLIHRSWRDHGRCKRRYGAAWQRYCKRVPSIIIPKIF